MIAERYEIPLEKTKQLKDILMDKNIDALLVFSREHSDPILPFLIGDDAIHTAAAFFTKSGKNIMLTSISDKAKFQESGIFDEVITYNTNIDEEFIPVVEKLEIENLAINISEDESLCDGLTQGMYLNLLELLGKEFLENNTVSSKDILVELRTKKTDTEIKRLKKAIDITQEIYKEVFSNIRCGMTEVEIAQLFVEGMKKYDVTNGVGSGYEYPIVCLVRAGLAHRNPGNTVAIPGDILIIDFSVRYKGYVSDIARTAYFLKESEISPPVEVKKAFSAAYDAITQSIEAIKPGIKGFEVDSVGRKAIEKHGYPTVRHSVGHQIGVACHEMGVRLSPKERPNSEGPLEERMVFAVEPTVIQDDGLPCMLVEENVLIHKDRTEILSARQSELILIPRNEEADKC